MRFKLEGVLPAILTPFTRGGKHVDYEKAGAWADALAKKGVHGIFVAGSTGEGLLMSLDERKRLAEALMEAVGKKIKVVVQTGCLDTMSTIALTQHAQEIGAHAVGVYTPAFYRYGDEALYRHFAMVAQSAPKMPLLLYDIPRFTGNALSPELILRLATKVESVVGMKDSSGDMVHLSRVLAEAPKGFTVINGADEFTYQAYLTGAAGSVALTANVVPEMFLSILQDTKAGKLKPALATQRSMGAVMKALGYGQKIATYKEAVRLMGFDTGHVRPPQPELTAAEKRNVQRALGDLGLV